MPPRRNWYYERAGSDIALRGNEANRLSSPVQREIAWPGGPHEFRKRIRTRETQMGKSMTGRLAAAVVAAMLAPGFAWAETPQELYDKAKAERELVFYSGGPAAPHENRAKLFMQEYPGITVKVTGGFSNVLNEQIEKQMADGKLAVDMAFFQTVQDFVGWKKRGELASFKPDGFDQIYPNFRDADGAYMALSANALTYAYNTAQQIGRAHV